MSIAASTGSNLSFVLRLAVALGCAGHAGWLLRDHDTPLVSWLWGAEDVGGLALSEQAALAVQKGLAIFFGVAALLVIVRPFAAVLYGVCVIQVVLAWSMWRTHSGYQTDLSPLGEMGFSPLAQTLAGLHPFAEQAARIVAPLALVVVERRRRAGWAGLSQGVEWIIRIGVALTFAAHGLEALQHYGPFLDMLILPTGRAMTETTAGRLLTVIGTIDFVLALLVVTTQWRGVAWYMAAWGLITALARIAVGGLVVGSGLSTGWDQFALRAAHWALPLVLALAWRPPRGARSLVELIKPNDEPGA